MKNVSDKMEFKGNESLSLTIGNTTYQQLYVTEPKILTFSFEQGNDRRVTSSREKNGTEYVWNEHFEILPGKHYSVAYLFYYFKDLKKMMYIFECKESVPEDGETQEEADERTERELSDDIEEQVSEAFDQIRISCTIVGRERGEARTGFEYVDALSNPGEYEKGINEAEINTGEVEQIANKVLGVVTNIGIVISVLIAAGLGLKYIVGSVDQKAEYKKDMIPYLIGVIILFSICSILKILYQLGQDINISM